MKKLKMLALALGMSLALTACGGNEDNADKETAGDAGQTTTASGGDAAKVYQNKCSSCHATNLEGGVGPKLADVGSRLSKEEIEQVILKGRGNMPKGLIKGDDADKVAKWLSEQK